MIEPIKVLYIAGAGRSGTTLLDCMLGQMTGLSSAGEVTHLWDRGLLGDELCGCGQPFSRCPFWQCVVDRALGSVARNPQGHLALRRSVCALTNLPRIVLPHLRTPGFGAKVASYSKLLAQVYGAIRDAAQCQVVVDSSKYPPEAYLLRETPKVEPYIVHVVRNPNAVAYAWKKRTWRPEVHDRSEPMPRYPAVQTAMAWNVFNWLIERLGHQGVPYVRIRYEDLIRRPEQSILSVCALLGMSAPDLSFIGDGHVRLDPNHTVSGNPIRLDHGTVPLLLDREWEHGASGFQKALVNALTCRQQSKYGYLG